MLVSGGIALLMTSMWSFRQGDRWLFWTYLITILSPYAMTLWIHYDIGYRDQFHLAPVYIGLVLLFAGLVLSHRYLVTDATTTMPRDQS
jgi:dihydroorotate dehydrogenase